jgi:hypothetical protein
VEDLVRVDVRMVAVWRWHGEEVVWMERVGGRCVDGGIDARGEGGSC